jgi:tetratricopeptide (TPR) repeat protein
MASWDREALINLRETLATLYPTKADALRIATDAGLETGVIEFVPGVITTWFNVLEYAKPRDQVENVVRRALEENPDNDTLRRALEGRPQGIGTSWDPSPKVSVARLPPTGQHLFGRKRELDQLDAAWADASTNFFSIVAWGGIGKSSLVNRWLGRIAADRYRGARRVYGWSFYRQGTGRAPASADEFITSALEWFGDAHPAQGEPWARGARLAELVRRQRTLLILDGVEPLQAPPGPDEGRITDPALATLVRELAADHPGLCIATSRQLIADIAQYAQSTAVVLELEELSDVAGAELLRTLGVRGNEDEMRLASCEFGGHALALNLLGTFLRDICAGEIGRRREIALSSLVEPNSRQLVSDSPQGAHARRIMASYEKKLGEGAGLAILRLLGLFDRPADEGTVKALRSSPVIVGLTDSIIGLSGQAWVAALTHLRRARLLEADPDNLGTIDAHPLVREYFSRQLESKNPAAWQQGHRRIFEHLSKKSDQYPKELYSLFPLFQAVNHGCLAGRHSEALRNIYIKRIQRGRTTWFATKSFGVPAIHLSALSGFFESPWQIPAEGLDDRDKVYVLTEVAYELRALGRLRESIPSLEAALALCIRNKDWRESMGPADNLSEVYLYLGDVHQAVEYAGNSVEYSDKSGKLFERMASRSTLGNAFHQAGEFAKAASAFQEAEALQQARQRDRPYLRSVNGLQYCDLLLSRGAVSDAIMRARLILHWLGDEQTNLVPRAMCGVLLAKALLRDEKGGHDHAVEARELLFSAVNSLRAAGQMHELPSALLGRAVSFRLLNSPPALDDAKRDLDEAYAIAARSAMKLSLVDVKCELAHLHLAKGDIANAGKQLQEAKAMVEITGYRRRKPDIEGLLRLCVESTQRVGPPS